MHVELLLKHLLLLEDLGSQLLTHLWQLPEVKLAKNDWHGDTCIIKSRIAIVVNVSMPHDIVMAARLHKTAVKVRLNVLVVWVVAERREALVVGDRGLLERNQRKDHLGPVFSVIRSSVFLQDIDFLVVKRITVSILGTRLTDELGINQLLDEVRLVGVVIQAVVDHVHHLLPLPVIEHATDVRDFVRLQHKVILFASFDGVCVVLDLALIFDLCKLADTWSPYEKRKSPLTAHKALILGLSEYSPLRRPFHQAREAQLPRNDKFFLLHVGGLTLHLVHALSVDDSADPETRS
jgi:hypothetical protein